MMTPGNYQYWRDSGKLDSLVPSGALLSDKLTVLSEHRQATSKLFAVHTLS
jgi:hypothetical protein